MLALVGIEMAAGGLEFGRLALAGGVDMEIKAIGRFLFAGFVEAILGESIGPSHLIGAVLVLASVALIVGIRLPTARIREFVERLWTSAPRMAANSESRG